jgi:hypothetical protein
MSPIEHVWDALAIEEEGDNIPQAIINSLISSM